MNFSNALKAKDWSVVAWGAKGPVAITHRRGFTSDQLPVAPARNTPGPTPGPTPPTPEPEPEPVDPCEADFEIWEDRVLSGCNEPTSQESSFLSAMTSYAITPNADNYCMRKSLEKSFTDDNGETGYQSYSELACDDENISVVVKVKMET